MRVALLPYPGDPFLLNYWLSFFDNVWGEEVDKLYIGLNSPIENDVVNYIKARIARSNILAGSNKIVLDYVSHQADHGPTINKLLDYVEGDDNIMLVEDDGFIFKKGIVSDAFKLIESGAYKIVGSKRGSCSAEISEKAKEVWGLDYEGEGDQGPNFWPNFFFCSKALLLKTDRHFSAKAWKQGEIIEPLGLTVTSEIVNGDTFVWTSLQLRALVAEHEIFYYPQYHGHPDDLRHYENRKYLFDGKAPWTHVGSLSSGINVGGLLRDGNDRPLAQRRILPGEPQTLLPVQYCQSEMEHKEFERRVQWWLTSIEYFYNEIDGLNPRYDFIKEFADLYRQAVDQIIYQFGLNRKEIMKRQAVYKELMGI